MIKDLLAELKACKNVEMGKEIHLAAIRNGCITNVYVASSLVNMYGKFGSLQDARMVFSGMRHPTVVSWNVLIFGYADNGEGQKALNVFSNMQLTDAIPNALTHVAALKSCTSLETKQHMKEQCMFVHSHAVKSDCDSDIRVASTLIDVYSKCGCLEDAQNVFDRMMYHNTVSWTALISGYAENGKADMALKLFARMQTEGCVPDPLAFVAAFKACVIPVKEGGRPNVNMEKGIDLHFLAVSYDCHLEVRVASTLVDVYAKLGSMLDARRVFDGMLDPNVVSWTALISGYTDNGQDETAVKMFSVMQSQGCQPNYLTYLAALKACGKLGALEAGKAIHKNIMETRVNQELSLINSLMDFYGKCGSMMDAQELFDSLTLRDLITWTSLMAGYSRMGNTNLVFDLFDKLEDAGLIPDGVTFLCVLATCSHAGLLDKGKEYLERMYTEYGIEPGVEHYSCIIDMFGRANKLNDLKEWMNTFPFKPNCVTWTTIRNFTSEMPSHCELVYETPQTC